ncbi:hypothetical protein [Vibrio barjaei]|uniref:hypothetical protein n=1 Tax=Vibrio barjaei TaxID=1676683 RepID=UPI00228465B3|nr:hypothetical protein [Vibrio barjaei]MCY9870803.1 hypothetical protein [Vibrio barjaei]
MKSAAPIVDMMFFLVLFAMINYLFVDGDFIDEPGEDNLLIVRVSSSSLKKPPNINDGPGNGVAFRAYVERKGDMRKIEHAFPQLRISKTQDYSTIIAPYNEGEVDILWFALAGAHYDLMGSNQSIYINLIAGTKSYDCEYKATDPFVIGKHVFVSIDIKTGDCDRL